MLASGAVVHSLRQAAPSFPPAHLACVRFETRIKQKQQGKIVVRAAQVVVQVAQVAGQNVAQVVVRVVAAVGVAVVPPA